MTSEKSFSIRLKEKRMEMELTQEQMAPLLGMKLRMYQLYERGDYDSSTSLRREKYLKKLAQLKHDSIGVHEDKTQTGYVMAGRGNIIFVPLTAVGGFLQGYEDVVYVDKLQRFSLPGILGEYYAFEVEGDSMHDKASPGDWAIAAPEEKLDYMRKGRMYVLQTIDGILIKNFEKMDREKATFTSHNKEYKPITIPLKELKKIYFVNRVVKKI